MTPDPRTLMIVGNLEKPFHRPECQCKHCEQWRRDNGKPTYEELERQAEILRMIERGLR